MASVKHEDFGEKIGGAKKDLWAARGLQESDLEEMNDREAEKFVTKDNIWKKPDYQAMLDDGQPVALVYFKKRCRDYLAPVPKYFANELSFRENNRQIMQKQYIQTVSAVRDIVENLSSVEEIPNVREQLSHRVECIAKPRTGKDHVCFYKMSRERYAYCNAAVSLELYNLLRIVEEYPSEYERYLEREARKAQFGVPKEQRVPKGYSIVNLYGQWHVLKNHRPVSPECNDYQEALAWAKEDAQSKQSERKSRFVPPQLEHIERTGPDVRNEREIVGQNYLEDFGFRGGEFGNWTNQQDRQASLNMGYEALKDLAAALQISDKDISLGGQLSIAFGSRGRGGALAHYEPMRKVINLTKMKGAGALAHEWWHALDDYLGDQFGSRTSLLTGEPHKYELFQKLLRTIKEKPEPPEQTEKRYQRNMGYARKEAETAWDSAFANNSASPDSPDLTELKNRYMAIEHLQVEDDDYATVDEAVNEAVREILRSADNQVALTTAQMTYLSHTAQTLYYLAHQKMRPRQISTQYYSDSTEIGKHYSRENGYWNSPEELTARAFECYILDKLPFKSDYLVAHAETVSYQANGTEFYGYPRGEERKAINAVFDEIFADLKERHIFTHEEKPLYAEIISKQAAEEKTETPVAEEITPDKEEKTADEPVAEAVADKEETVAEEPDPDSLTNKEETVAEEPAESSDDSPTKIWLDSDSETVEWFHLNRGSESQVSRVIDFGSFQNLAQQYDFSDNPDNSELFLARLNEMANPPLSLSPDEVKDYLNSEAHYADFTPENIDKISEEIDSILTDKEAERDIDRGEALYGADGELAFGPHSTLESGDFEPDADAPIDGSLFGNAAYLADTSDDSQSPKEDEAPAEEPIADKEEKADEEPAPDSLTNKEETVAEEPTESEQDQPAIDEPEEIRKNALQADSIEVQRKYKSSEVEKYEALMHQTAREVMSDGNLWIGFLKFSGRFYKYDFQDRLLIYAQRPEATACAEAKLWNDTMHRPVKEGADEIALLVDEGEETKLRYVFDIADTQKQPNSISVSQWKATKRHLPALTEAFYQAFDVNEVSPDGIMRIANQLTAEWVKNNKETIIRFGEDMPELSQPDGVIRAFANILTTSVNYTVLSRLSKNADQYFDEVDFSNLRHFRTMDAICTMGEAIHSLSSQTLREIEKTIRTFERNINTDRSAEHEHHNVPSRGQVQSPEHRSGSPEGNAEQVRTNAAAVSSGTRSYPVHDPVRQGGTVSAPVRGVGEGTGNAGRDGPEIGEGGRREGRDEGHRPVEMGRVDEHVQGSSGGNHREGAHLRVNGASSAEPGSEEEVKQAEENESSAFSLPDEAAAHSGGETASVASPAEDDIADRQEPNKEESVATVPQGFRITDDHLGEGGEKTRFHNNIAAIQTLKQIESENRAATAEEQEILSKYVGWGGLSNAFDDTKPEWANEYRELKSVLTESEYASAMRSTLDSFYTSPVVIRAMYDAVESFGFRDGNILEPSCGIGNFFGVLPDSMRQSNLYGVELDSITGRIAKKLYPQADITVAGYETTSRPGFYDLAIGNIPFGNFKVDDREYNRLNFPIHDYFFAKTLDQVRPGGIIAFITSHYTMDKADPTVRQYIAQRAELLGAIRLPNNAFKRGAGTQVVSDILFLQKREHPVITEGIDWISRGINANGLVVNSYFASHPNMVLGDMQYVTGRFGKELTVMPREGAELSEQLQAAIANIHGEYISATRTDIEENTAASSIKADPDVRNYSYTVVDGKVYYRENSVMVLSAQSEEINNRTAALVELREATNEVIRTQREGAREERIKDAQAKLNEMYDRFAETYGRINTAKNEEAFAGDSSYYLLCSLENTDSNGNFLSKAAIFTRQTVLPDIVVTSADTPEDALAVSIAECGGVDLKYMAYLLDAPGQYDEIIQALDGAIYRDPKLADKNDITKGWKTADEYLSGNVREKLNQALEASEDDDFYNKNVAALQQVQPKPLTADEIDVRLGATWIPPKYIERFIHDKLLPSTYWYGDVKFNEYSGEWVVTERKVRSLDNTNIYGTAYMPALTILQNTLNMKDVTVYDEVKGKRVVNQVQTELAHNKQKIIERTFEEWIWSHPERRRVLEKIYNERFNNTRLREYNGKYLRFAGKNPEITLRDHQVSAIARVVYGGNTLLAHEVGAGKTWEMTAAAMELKRLGLCRKPMFVVPNNLVTQWANDFMRLYPSANILAPGKQDFTPANRKKFCARIATGEYDAVIITHSQFESIPMSTHWKINHINEQICEVEYGIKHSEKDVSTKSLARTKESLKNTLNQLLKEDRKDDVIAFDDLGVDYLFVDEAHMFKNLETPTKMRNIAGLSSRPSQRASDMYMKCRYIDEVSDNRGVVFATGTPISNSMTEMYVMMRYLQHDLLSNMNLQYFDAWASTFGEVVMENEYAPEGNGFRVRKRFANFHNIPELMTLFTQTADIKMADQLHLPVPAVKNETIVAKPTEAQKELIQSLSKRAEKIHNGEVSRKDDNMLWITTDGRKLGLDQRLIDPSLPDDPNSKVNLCIKKVYEIYRETEEDRKTQLIFCDFSTPKSAAQFDVYHDIRKKLMDLGVPRKEIAFVHDATTDKRKEALFAKVRDGQVRILLGSTGKLGTGVNVQDRLIAAHHLDAPWRPADMSQRDGRIVRQGNRNPEVQIYRYVTEGTFDAYLYQTLEIKQKFIGQIMTSRTPARSCNDVDQQALSYAEVKALCAGNPRVKEKMDLENDLARLNMLFAEYKKEHFHMQNLIQIDLPTEIASKKKFIAGCEKDEILAREHPLPDSEKQPLATDGASGQITLEADEADAPENGKDTEKGKSKQKKEKFVGIEINGVTYTDKREANKAISSACNEYGYESKDVKKIGHYRGFELELTFRKSLSRYEIALKGSVHHYAPLSKEFVGNISRLDDALTNIPARITHAKIDLEQLESQLATLKEEYTKPFVQAEEYEQKQIRLEELTAELDLDKKDIADEVYEGDDTQGKDVDEDELHDEETETKRCKNVPCEQMESALREYCDALGVRVSIAAMRPTLLGTYNVGHKEIQLNENLKGAERLSSFLHEFSHAVMHTDEDPNKPESQKELEADSLTMMLSHKYGLDIPDSRSLHFTNHLFASSEPYAETVIENIPETVRQATQNAVRAFEKHAPKLTSLLESHGVYVDRDPPAPVAADVPETGRLFVDMDGTIARFHDDPYFAERMFEQGFFENLQPFDETVTALHQYICDNPKAQVYVLSACVDTKTCVAEKEAWLDRYLPEIDADHRLFVPVGQDKTGIIPGGIQPTDVLLDDYNKNLGQWREQGGVAVKYTNNVNDRGQIGEMWQGDRIAYNMTPDEQSAALQAHTVPAEVAEQNTSMKQAQRLFQAAVHQVREGEEAMGISREDSALKLDFDGKTAFWTTKNDVTAGELNELAQQYGKWMQYADEIDLIPDSIQYAPVALLSVPADLESEWEPIADQISDEKSSVHFDHEVVISAETVNAAEREYENGAEMVKRLPATLSTAPIAITGERLTDWRVTLYYAPDSVPQGAPNCVCLADYDGKLNVTEISRVSYDRIERATALAEYDNRVIYAKDSAKNPILNTTEWNVTPEPETREGDEPQEDEEEILMDSTEPVYRKKRSK